MRFPAGENDPCAAPQTSGNDVFYRNPYNVNENLFVDISSPSSSRYGSVSALGSPEAAAKVSAVCGEADAG